MADGTVCRTGPTCKRHGRSARQAELAGKIADLLDQITPTSMVEQPKETVEQVKALPHLSDVVDVTEVRPGAFLIRTQSWRDKPGYGSSSYQSWTTWYREDRKTIGMMKVSRKDFSEEDQKRWNLPACEYVLCDVEVVESARGRGVAMQMVKDTEKAGLTEGNAVHTTGNYTPEGFRSLGGKLPLSKYDSNRRGHVQSFNSMTFVHDWEKFQGKM